MVRAPHDDTRRRETYNVAEEVVKLLKRGRRVLCNNGKREKYTSRICECIRVRCPAAPR